MYRAVQLVILKFFMSTCPVRADVPFSPEDMGHMTQIITVSKLAGVCQTMELLGDFNKEKESEEYDKFSVAFFDYVASRKGLDREGFLRACRGIANDYNIYFDMARKFDQEHQDIR